MDEYYALQSVYYNNKIIVNIIKYMFSLYYYYHV